MEYLVCLSTLCLNLIALKFFSPHSTKIFQSDELASYIQRERERDRERDPSDRLQALSKSKILLSAGVYACVIGDIAISPCSMSFSNVIRYIPMKLQRTIL